MKNIILIDHEPLTIRRKQIFRLDEFLHAGFQVESWDCSQYFHPGMQLSDTISRPYLRRFDNLGSIASALKECDISNTVFIVETFRVWKNRRFFRLLSECHCYTVRMELYATANLPDLPAIRKILHSSPLKIIRAIIGMAQRIALHVYDKLYKVSGYDQQISSGGRLGSDISVNHPDWELYVKSLSYPVTPICECPYTVFLDEFFPSHPDLQFFSRNHHASVVKYHIALNRFFDRYEQQTGNRVVIAAHPKADYTPTVFNGRTIIKYKCAELVRDAQAVLMHSSAALSYVMMYDKPLALIITQDYKQTFALYINMLRISRLVQLPIHRIDTGRCVITPNYIAPQIRKKYIYDYLTNHGTETEKTSDILVRFFQSL